MTFKVIKGHPNCRYSISNILHSSNNVFILHCFRDITTFPVCMTPCDLHSPPLSTRQVKLQGKCAFRSVWKHIVDNICYIYSDILERFKTATVTFKITQGHSYRCHSIGRIWFHFSICYCFRYIISYFTKFKGVTGS